MSETKIATMLVLALLNLIALGLLAWPRIARRTKKAKKERQPRKAAGAPDAPGDQLLALVEEIERAERSQAPLPRGESRLAEDLERWHAAGGDDLFLPQAADSCRSRSDKTARGRVA